MSPIDCEKIEIAIKMGPLKRKYLSTPENHSQHGLYKLYRKLADIDIVVFKFKLGPGYVLVYYASNKILSSDWLNTNLILDDVWLVGSNVRL